MARINFFYLISGGIFIFIILLYNILFYSYSKSYFNEDLVINKHVKCKWNPYDPVFFHLKTKLQVNYEASHWFHMAENFMTYHSKLRKLNQLANSTAVYYNFDKVGFITSLNGITRFLVYLGTILPNSRTNELYFVHLDDFSPNNLNINDNIYIDAESPENQFIKLTPNIVSTNRFTKIEEEPISKKGQICVKYLGEIGGNWPTPQRGHWFPNTGDIQSFRQKIADACPFDPTLYDKYKKQKKYKLVIYQRDLNRKISNQNEAIEYINGILNRDKENWEIIVLMHSSSRSPCQLSHILNDADVLVTPHGFQSMLLLFLPVPALIFEVFPYRYYKRGYGPFGKEYGLQHSGVMSPATTWHTSFFLSLITTSACMQNKYCRNYARNQDVKLTEHGAKKLASFIDSYIELLQKDFPGKNIYSISKKDY